MNNGEQRVVLYHREYGVYLDDVLGYPLWSKRDPENQWTARTWDGPESLMEFVGDFMFEFDDWEARTVNVAANDYRATVRECVKAGLPAWNPEPKETFRAQGP